MTEDAPFGGAQGEHVEPSKVLLPTFTGSSPNVTPVERNPAARSTPAPESFEHESAVLSHKDLRPDDDPIRIALVGNSIKGLGNRSFKSNGALPTGFPKARHVIKDVVAGKIPVRGQSRFCRVDIRNTDPQVYHDALPLPPRDLLAALVPLPQILLYRDGLPYPKFLRSFSVANLLNSEWTKLIGPMTFLILPNVAPFQDEAPFLSHRTIIRIFVAMLQTAKKQEKPTTVWVVYESRSNVADVEVASILDRRIDLVPTVNFLWLSVLCPIIHLAHCEDLSENLCLSPNPLDHTLRFFQLTSLPLPKGHVRPTVGYFPKDVPSHEPFPPSIYTPASTLFHVRVDLLTAISRVIDGIDVQWYITGSLPMLLLLNGLSSDDTSTVLNELQIPRIGKCCWPVLVKSASENYKLFDFFVPFDVLGKFYDEQPALMEIGICMGLLDRSVKETSSIITHQPRFVKGKKGQRKMPSNEIRTAIEMNPPLYRKFAFLLLLNKYDLFGMVHEPMLMQPTVQEVENLRDLICLSAHTQQRVFAKEVANVVQPAFTLVCFSHTFSVKDVLNSTAGFGPVRSHQLFQQSGILLVKYQSTDSAALAYGAILPGPVYFTSGIADQDTNVSLTERLPRVDLAAIPPPKLNEANLAAVGLPDLAILISRLLHAPGYPPSVHPQGKHRPFGDHPSCASSGIPTRKQGNRLPVPMSQLIRPRERITY